MRHFVLLAYRRLVRDRTHSPCRAAIRNQLAHDGVPLDLCRWRDAWEDEAVMLRLERGRDDCQVGAAWIAEQRSARKQPA